MQHKNAYFVLSTLFLLVQLQVCSIIRVCHAQLLSPTDMAVGRWKLSLKRRDRTLLESMVFPLQVPSSDASAPTRTVRTRSTRGRRRLDCELILDEDGTFTLMPPSSFVDGNEGDRLSSTDDNIPGDETPVLEDESRGSSTDGTPDTTQRGEIHQPLRGIWKLNPNPYCVTDRQFDELTLKSIPKVRVRINPRDNEEEEKVVTCREKIMIELNCNVWGRFGSNPIRHFLKRPRGKDAGRLTHGTMSIVKTTASSTRSSRSWMSEKSVESTPNASTRRVLCGTFQARSVPVSIKEKVVHGADLGKKVVGGETSMSTTNSQDMGYGFV